MLLGRRRCAEQKVQGLCGEQEQDSAEAGQRSGRSPGQSETANQEGVESSASRTQRWLLII